MKRREAGMAYLFLLPSFIGVIYFLFLPFLNVVKRSFSKAMNNVYTGLGNYEEILTNDTFLLAAKNTGRFLLLCLPLLLLLSLFFSMLLSGQIRRIHNRFGSEKEKGSWCEFIKTSYLIPVAIPAASIALIWKVLFHQNGLINAIGTQFFGSEPIDFLNSDQSFFILIFTYLWKNIGYDMVLWLAGLSGIPGSYYEAASIDGAGGMKKFLYITLPELVPTFMITTILSLINSFKVFREAYLISGNYPNESIYLLQHILNNWFSKMDIHKMCAAAVMIAIAILLFVFLLQRLERRIQD